MANVIWLSHAMILRLQETQIVTESHAAGERGVGGWRGEAGTLIVFRTVTPPTLRKAHL